MSDIWTKYDPDKWTGVYPGFYRQNMHVTQANTAAETIAYMIQNANGDKTLYEESILFPPYSGLDLTEAMERFDVNEDNYYDILEDL